MSFAGVYVLGQLARLRPVEAKNLATDLLGVGVEPHPTSGFKVIPKSGLLGFAAPAPIGLVAPEFFGLSPSFLIPSTEANALTRALGLTSTDERELAHALDVRAVELRRQAVIIGTELRPLTPSPLCKRFGPGRSASSSPKSARSSPRESRSYSTCAASRFPRRSRFISRMTCAHPLPRPMVHGAEETTSFSISRGRLQTPSRAVEGKHFVSVRAQTFTLQPRRSFGGQRRTGCRSWAFSAVTLTCRLPRVGTRRSCVEVLRCLITML